jgi:hypothetical protein
MESAVKVPLSERFNFRIIIFAAIIGVVIGYPIYILVSEKITGGIHSSGGYIETNLKAMGNFVFDDRAGTLNDVPKQWRELDGKKLSLVGEIFAPDQAAAEISNFQLVYSIAKCCFGGPPKVQERVFCSVPNGKSIEYYGGFYRVKGTLHIKVEKDEFGVTTRLFTMDVESAEPAT